VDVVYRCPIADSGLPDRVECVICRNREGGRGYRRRLAAFMGIRHIGFACPAGRPWIPPRGFGDTIAAVASAVGIHPCGGCIKRKTWLNRVLPYSVAVWLGRLRRLWDWVRGH
jgi:hypothetical protein